MPTVTLNKSVFEKLMGKKLTLEQLKDRIAMLGTDVEKIEGNEIHVEIFPNRPDLLSEQGLARAMASFLGIRRGLRTYAITKGKQQVLIDKNLKDIRPYTVCAIVRGLKLDDEKIRTLIQIQEKLHTTFCRNRKKSAIGVYPLEHITLPIHFKACKPSEIRFRPLDMDRTMTAGELLELHPKGKEFGHLLHGLSRYPVFVDATGEVLSVPPIINSEHVGRVTTETTAVFVEFSGFDFPHLSIGLNILCAALADMGGKIESMELVYPDKKIRTPDFTPRKMKLDLGYITKRLGISLTEQQVTKLLACMGYGYAKGHALIPAYRADVLHQVDLAEDIAIAYGYENFKECMPNIGTFGQQDQREVLKQKISQILTGVGMLEVNTYHLIDRAAQTTALLRNSTPIEILDPVSLEYNTLRETMLAPLLEVLKQNRRSAYPQKIFECGAVFERGKTETGVREHHQIAAVFADNKADYTLAQQHVDYCLRMLAVPYTLHAASVPPFIEGRAAEIRIRGKIVGMVGEFHPQVISTAGLEMPICGFWMELDAL